MKKLREIAGEYSARKLTADQKTRQATVEIYKGNEKLFTLYQNLDNEDKTKDYEDIHIHNSKETQLFKDYARTLPYISQEITRRSHSDSPKRESFVLFVDFLAFILVTEIVSERGYIVVTKEIPTPENILTDFYETSFFKDELEEPTKVIEQIKSEGWVYIYDSINDEFMELP